ncbi:GTPase Era [Patescibacteria group bacterium]|nr:GTPase Era [Patescibacteria group bacterium]
MKSGFAVLIGRSNVGKSTLTNALVGTKVAITTPKPQTTRRPIHGILTRPEGQVVFVDTPGLMQKGKDELTQKLNQYVESSLHGVDVILYIVDPTREIGNEEKHVLNLIKDIQKPKLMIINKIDDPASKTYIDFYRDLSPNFDETVEVSAKSGSNLDMIEKWIFKNLPEGELLYPEHTPSNLTEEEKIAEIIREKLFLRLREEIPYTTSVQVEEIDKRDNGTFYIRATIYTTNERYKRIIIGKGACGIKEIVQSSRRELQTISQSKIFLDLTVEVDEHWIANM